MQFRFPMLLMAAFLALLSNLASAEIKTMLFEYPEGETTCEAFVAYDDAVKGPRPGVLIVHQWMGITDHEREIAKKLAGMGYFAFCADIYGKGVRPADASEAGKLAGQFRGGDRGAYRRRLVAALGELRGSFMESVDPTRVAAIGYCFGGTGVLELARVNADVAGVASFHGGLSRGAGATETEILPKVLVMHGDADPYVPAAEADALKEELRTAKADWEFISYSGAVHSFTDRNADSDGARYNAKADARSWERLSDFLGELFKR
ncbi:dienelactone hydrolase family protein [bacterium]|nr:dienelactone hydrolase family protein [bacterium]